MISMQIGHTHLKVRDLDCSAAFYERFLNLKQVERVGDQYLFMSGSAFHHNIALQAVGSEAPGPIPHGVGLYHVAFEVPDRRSFAEAYRALSEGGVHVATVDHLISWAMYFDDPDGNGLEIYWDTRREPGGQPLWHGKNVPLPEAKILAALDGNAAGD